MMVLASGAAAALAVVALNRALYALGFGPRPQSLDIACSAAIAACVVMGSSAGYASGHSGWGLALGALAGFALATLIRRGSPRPA